MSLRYAGFAVILAAAGIPIYIHLPSFATTQLGISLSTLGAILLFIRILDFAQDPILGWLSDREATNRPLFAGVGAIGLGGGFVALFAVVPPPLSPAVWLTLTLIVIFTSFSLLTVLYYGQGVRLMAGQGSSGHYRLAGGREAGTVVGILIATTLPSLLQAMGREQSAYRDFALLYAVMVLIAAVAMHPLWRQGVVPTSRDKSDTSVLRAALRQGSIRSLLVLGFLNAMPVAATSTLFLFFVEDRLQLGNLAGPFLLLFFAAAGASAPLWSMLGQRYGARPVMLPAMILSIVSFLGVALLSEGQGLWFAAICLASGIALGADMVLLPALFAATIDREKLPEGLSFGLWAFAAKASLAVVAALVLPVLDRAGFAPGGPNTPEALWVLTFCYALLPCSLKCVAIFVLFKLPSHVDDPVEEVSAHRVHAKP